MPYSTGHLLLECFKVAEKWKIECAEASTRGFAYCCCLLFFLPVVTCHISFIVVDSWSKLNTISGSGVLTNLSQLGKSFSVGFLRNLEKVLLKKRLWRRCFPVNFAKFIRTPFLQNTSGRLLLNTDLGICILIDKTKVKINTCFTPLVRLITGHSEHSW